MDVKDFKFKITPSSARHLVKLSRLTNFTIVPEIKEIAKIDVVDVSQTHNYNIPEKALQRAVQDVVDSKGRCLLVCNKPTHGVYSALLGARMAGHQKILVLTSPEMHDASKMAARQLEHDFTQSSGDKIRMGDGVTVHNLNSHSNELELNILSYVITEKIDQIICINGSEWRFDFFNPMVNLFTKLSRFKKAMTIVVPVVKNMDRSNQDQFVKMINSSLNIIWNNKAVYNSPNFARTNSVTNSYSSNDVKILMSVQGVSFALYS